MTSGQRVLVMPQIYSFNLFIYSQREDFKSDQGDESKVQVQGHPAQKQ